MVDTDQLNKDSHARDDVDSDLQAHHHTLGTRPHQAAAGNHGHSDLNDLITAEALTRDSADIALDARLDVIEAKVIAYSESSGTVTNAALAAGTGTSVAVVFPVGRFSVAPNVLVTPSSNGYNAGSVAAITSSGCTARNYNPQATGHTGTETIYWHAVQMLSGSANG